MFASDNPGEEFDLTDEEVEILDQCFTKKQRDVWWEAIHENDD